MVAACGRILHGSKSFGKYLQCFHVSRVYFFAFLHQIFILEVFIIKKMQPTSQSVLSVQTVRLIERLTILFKSSKQEIYAELIYIPIIRKDYQA